MFTNDFQALLPNALDECMLYDKFYRCILHASWSFAGESEHPLLKKGPAKGTWYVYRDVICLSKFIVFILPFSVV